jgi:hypothetical protein
MWRRYSRVTIGPNFWVADIGEAFVVRLDVEAFYLRRHWPALPGRNHR